MIVLFGTAIIVTFVLASAFWLYRQWKLAREGVLTQARVTKKRRSLVVPKGPLSNVIEYDFLTPRGEFSRNSVFVGKAVSLAYEEGSEIEIVYLKSNPGLNGTKHMVNKSRGFINLPPL